MHRYTFHGVLETGLTTYPDVTVVWTVPSKNDGFDRPVVSHRERLIESFEREGEREWRRSEARPGAILRVHALGLELSVDEIYAAAAPI